MAGASAPPSKTRLPVDQPDPSLDTFTLTFSLVTEAAAPADLDDDALERLTSFVIQAEGGEGQWEITVALVHDDRLQALHRDFMGVDTPTDVMTFPLGEDDNSAKGGDLVISVDHANANLWGLTPEDEIRFLVTHGLLHLLGWRDDSEEERAQMLERQRALIERWERIEG
jgi:probable rRNA maturation factor